MTPTIHLTNWPSTGLHGPGRKWTIMAAPRRWERGEGVVRDFVPPLGLLRDVQAGRCTAGFYFTELRRLWTRAEHDWNTALGAGSPFAPGVLLAAVPVAGADPRLERVADGDTLLCGCSKAKAAEGLCHRVTAAPFLLRAGWRVVLDGAELARGPA